MSNYLTLEQIKKHLNIDLTFTDDDTYLDSLSYVAEEAVAKYLDCDLVDLYENGKLPSAIVHAMLLLIGNMYKYRESTTSGPVAAVPHSFELLCDLYRKFNTD